MNQYIVFHMQADLKLLFYSKSHSVSCSNKFIISIIRAYVCILCFNRIQGSKFIYEYVYTVHNLDVRKSTY